MRIRGWRATSARMRGRGLRIGLALAVGVALAFFSLLPVGPLGRTLPVASAHALLVRSDPKANAILQAPPAAVHAWFSEDLNPLTSKIVVVDPANREVDRGDSHVDSDNSKELEVSLPLLPAGTYIVVWRAQSADDGHVTGSSFIFRVARADGSVPPIPAVLPTGHFAGGAGIGTPGGATLDGPTVFQAISTWLALLFMTFWIGGVFWETWILNPNDGGRDPDLLAAARRSSTRFARFAPYALGGVLLADIGIIVGQALELSGGISPAVLSAILFGSRFGAFWWLRQGVALAALILALAVARGLLPNSAGMPAAGAVADLDDDVESIPDWRRELVKTLRDVPGLPARVIAGVRAQSGAGRLACALAGLLLIAFALSGHAAAVPANTFIYAIAVDLLHLFFEATWIGGLFYISLVFIPALDGLTPFKRARVLALGLPEFSAFAIVSAVLLAATGSLNTTIRLTSISQFLTTLYGKTLAVKIELFLVIVAISFYHAFFLRPRLARALVTEPDEQAASGDAAQARSLVRAGSAGTTPPPANATETDGDPPAPRAPGAGKPHSDDLPPTARTLEERIRDWLRREALLAGAVLLCVALLGIFAGSLAPSAPSTGPGTGGAFTDTAQVSGYAITLDVTPLKFGANTFNVTVKDASGKPVTDAGVIVETTMLDMDMGTQSTQIAAVGASAPGVYSGQTDLAMAGHWGIVVKVVLPDGKQTLEAPFKFSITY